ncbi:MAG TPA: hypothetical protein VIV55_02035 [Flavobacterium sp.]
MNEIVEIKSGKDIIDITFDEHVLCLKIVKPIIADWYDNEGTMGKYFALNTDFDRDKFICKFNDVLINGDEKAIKDKIIIFLELFKSGTYGIRSHEKLLTFDDVHNEYGNAENSSFYYYSFLNHNADGTNFMFSQPYSKISIERILFYKELIKSGKKPKVLTIASDNCDDNVNFILDGHYKILAYLYSGIPCNFIRISKMNHEEDSTKISLFNEYSYLLPNNLKNNIISNNPIMRVDNSIDSQKYNSEFDRYLKTFDINISGDVFRLIYKSIYSKNSEEKKWGLLKFRIIEERISIENNLCLYGIINEHLSLSQRIIISKEDFNNYIIETFGKSLNEIEKNIT